MSDGGFDVKVGLHQGSVLNPCLLAIVMDRMTNEIKEEAPWTMMFADYIMICSESKEHVEEKLESWRYALETLREEEWKSILLMKGRIREMKKGVIV